MKRNIFLSVAALATVMTMTVTSCSSSDDDEKQGGQPQVAYVWGTEGSIKTCDHLLFGTDGKENVNGTVIGIHTQGQADPEERHIPPQRMGICG